MAETKSTKKTNGAQPTTPTTQKPKKYTQEELDAAVKSAAEDAARAAVEQYIKNNPVTVAHIQEEYVTLLFMGIMAPDCVYRIGDMEFTRTGAIQQISKKDFLSGKIRNLDKALRRRKLIVTEGLTESERNIFGVNYREGELMTADTYHKLLDLDHDIVVNIFKNLCTEHKIAVARIYADAYMRRDNRIRLETVRALNDISKTTDKDGMFSKILKSMGDALTE